MADRILALVFCFGVCGCARDYEVDFPLQAANVSGVWVLSSAPQVVTNNFPTNYVPPARLDLLPDGSAKLYFVPIEQLVDSAPIPRSTWSFASGYGKWELRDWGNGGRHIWQVGLAAQTSGIEFTVGKERSGQLILVYTPDPDKDESVVFRRALAKGKKN